MMQQINKHILMLAFLGINNAAIALPIETEPALPIAVIKQLPKDYELMTFVSGFLNDDKLLDYLVVAHKKGEEAAFKKTHEGSPRPLFIFIQHANATFTAAKRNDYLVMRINEGGQCDPFEEDDDRLVIKNHYFTVQNSVACGDHWVDLTTFRYDTSSHDWLFHKRSSESWRFNESNSPDAEALVSNGIKVTKSNPKKPMLIEQFKR